MLKESITLSEIDIIFSGPDGAPDLLLKKKYLRRLYEKKNILYNEPSAEHEINAEIMNTWDYEISKSILREMFFGSDKCSLNKQKKDRIDTAIREWQELGLGKIKWPSAAEDIDEYTHKLNRREDLTSQEKDSIISDYIIRFRRIKELNQLKYDYIEYLVVLYNDRIIPTFGNIRGTDFYIDGLPFDQKVSKSVGWNFIKKYGWNYKKVAVQHPSLVAKSLYEHQDAKRFGSEPRFLLVCLDTDLTSDEIEAQIKALDLSKPMDIEFEFKGKDEILKKYKTSCYLILLHR